MKKFVVFILAAAFFFDGAALRGNAQQDVMTWKDCLGEAQLNHPDLLSAREKLYQTKQDKGIARSTGLPQLTASASSKRAGSDTTDTTDTYSYSVTAKQLLFDGFKNAQSVKKAQENIHTEEYNYFVTSSNIRFTLRQIFAQLLRLQNFVELTEQIALRREDNLKLVQLRYDAGREHRGSLLTAEANLTNARFEVEQAKRDLVLYQTKMSKALGRRTSAPIKISGGFTVKEQDREAPDFERLVDKTPSLQALAAKKEAARYSLNAANADFFPEVYLSSSTGRSGSSWMPEDDQWSIGVTVSVALFEGGNRMSQVSQARSALRQAQEDQRSGRDNVVVTLEENWGDLQDALALVEVQKKFLEAGEERAKIANAQYSSGLITFDDWIIIEDNLVSARKSYLNAQTNALISEAQWVQAKGGTLDYE